MMALVLGDEKRAKPSPSTAWQPMSWRIDVSASTSASSQMPTKENVMPVEATQRGSTRSARRPARGESRAWTAGWQTSTRPALARRQAAYALQVETEQKAHGEGRCVVDQGRQAREGEDPVVAEEPDVQQRVHAPQLVDDEHDHAGQTRTEQAVGIRLRQLGEPVHHRRQREDQQAGAGQVEAFAVGFGLVHLQHAGHDPHQQQAEGQVEPEDEPPAELLGDEAAHEWPQGQA